MHKEILTKEQIELLPFLTKMNKKFGLVGGTAIALHIGHRESIDFDLFIEEEFNNVKIKKIILKFIKIDKVIVNRLGEYTILVNGVKITFFYYPFKINYTAHFDKIIKMPSLLTLAAMKAYALGRRNRWKDYIDLYFIINKFHSIEKIVKRSKAIFKGEFNEKIFRIQLSYFEDIDYQEKIIFKKEFEVDEKIIKKALINYSLQK
jgi:hypothetical protein